MSHTASSAFAPVGLRAATLLVAAQLFATLMDRPVETVRTGILAIHKTATPVSRVVIAVLNPANVKKYFMNDKLETFWESQLAVCDYLLKQVSYGTCSNKFLAELEKEMLVPNNVRVHGTLKGVSSISGYTVCLDFPANDRIAFLKKPTTNFLDGQRRVVRYRLEELIDFDNYWWFPLKDETQFSITLNFLPPFPDVDLVNLQISCNPHSVVGSDAAVTTNLHMEAVEDIDYLFLNLGVQQHPSPGIQLSITDFSDYHLENPVQSVFSPRREFPFPKLSLTARGALEYHATCRIRAEPANMRFLKCEQDILETRLFALSESIPSGSPCGVTVTDPNGQEIAITRTIRANFYTATAQVFYSPFSPGEEEGIMTVQA